MMSIKEALMEAQAKMAKPPKGNTRKGAAKKAKRAKDAPAKKLMAAKKAKARKPKDWAKGHKIGKVKPLKTRLTGSYGPVRPKLDDLPEGAAVSNDLAAALEP